MDLVTSLPLPPDYWAGQSVDEIEKMTPPNADLFDSTIVPFGILNEAIPTDLAQDNLLDLFTSLTANMNDSMVAFMELIESTLDEEKVKQTTNLEEQVETLSEIFTSMHTTISRLKFHQARKQFQSVIVDK